MNLIILVSMMIYEVETENDHHDHHDIYYDDCDYNIDFYFDHDDANVDHDHDHVIFPQSRNPHQGKISLLTENLC